MTNALKNTHSQTDNNLDSRSENGLDSINVAVAVIYYQDQYLLGYRSSHQHQGDRYEFVGGKIEAHETSREALVREVGEETGIDIKGNVAVKLGRLHHDYGDKKVSLQVYHIELTAAQYVQHQYQDIGLEGQALTWVDKASLLRGDYPLPAANQTILAWLNVPNQLTITYPLAHFSQDRDPITAWLNYHKEAIKKDAWVYLRIKATGQNNTPNTHATLINNLSKLRPDIRIILPHKDGLAVDSSAMNEQIKTHHINHAELMRWAESPADSVITSRPLIVSCHDSGSIIAANRLAKARLLNNQPPVIAIFLSPVLATDTHPDAPALGWETWSQLAEFADMPVIALGGLSPSMIDIATNHGALSVAGIRRFMTK